MLTPSQTRIDELTKERDELRAKLNEANRQLAIETAYRAELGKILNEAIEKIQNVKVQPRTVYRQPGMPGPESYTVHDIVFPFGPLTDQRRSPDVQANHLRAKRDHALVMTHNPDIKAVRESYVEKGLNA